MKKTILIILCFALVLALLLGLAMIKERFMPRQIPAAGEELSRWDNALDELHATGIELGGDSIYIHGQGAAVQGTTVTIRYPGTYILSGALEDGQVVVDCDHDGKVYLELNSVRIHNGDGPAIFVRQAQDTVLYLPEGSESQLSDGPVYAQILTAEGIPEEDQPAAAVYSRDDLHIEGSGVLNVIGSCDAAVHCKDDLKFKGGTVNLSAPGDGAKGTESLAVEGGALNVSAGADGLQSTKGAVELSGGEIHVISGGDGIAALTELTVSGGSVGITAAQGFDHYGDISASGISAKGLKADSIVLLGGEIALNTADDGIHAGSSVLVEGGLSTLYSGDDGLSAGKEIRICGGEVNVAGSYEGMEAMNIFMDGGLVTVLADNNGLAATLGLLDEGLCAEDFAITVTDGVLSVSAPRAINTDGAFQVREGAVYLHGLSMEEETVAVGPGSVLSGGMTVIAGCLPEEEPIPAAAPCGSLYYRLAEPVPGGTAFEIADPAGENLFRYIPGSSYSSVFVCYKGLSEGLYELRVGQEVATVAVSAPEEAAGPVSAEMRGPGGF